MRQNPVWELTTSVSLILPVFASRRSRLHELFCPCARLHCRDRSAIHKIHKSVVLYNVPSTTRAALVAAQPGTTQVAGKEGSICLIPNGNRGRNRQKIPRIGPGEAARVFAQCEQLLESSPVLFENLRQIGFARLLAPLHDQILELAVQLDSWGDRTRARLIAELFAGLKGIPAEGARVEEIVQVSNVVVPCFLLELGRRRQHIEIEFPADPCDSGARFGLRAGPSCPVYSISSEQLVRLVAEAGEELVGLCYFGDQRSRENIEAQLAFTDATTDS